MSERQDPAAARAAHRELALERVGRVRAWARFDDDTLAEAARRLTKRLDAGDWNDDRYLRRGVRRFREMPSALGTPPDLSCDLPELAVVQLLSRTGPQNQFSVTPAGDVFAGDRLGYHDELERFYVTALCPILDDAADLLLGASAGMGGRLYVHTEPSRRVVERANNQSVLAVLRAE